TWDQSTNWMLDDPGLQNFGSSNIYLKKPGTFVKDYERLTDFAAGLGVKGIIVWGFLRDSHGGVEAAKRIASYAAGKGVAMMPGAGTTSYGGLYYEGNHPYNLKTFIEKYPSARTAGGICPSNPIYKEWILEGLDWMFETFPIGGINFENGDFFICDCDECKAHKENWPKDDPDFFRMQALANKLPLEHLKKQTDKNKDLLITWATYTGFLPGVEKGRMTMTPHMGCRRPALFDDIKQLHSTQWTLTRMVRQNPLALTKFLDDGTPEELFDNECWPKGLEPPVGDGVGFIHQGSQWINGSRYNQIISTIKEGCLRAYMSGLRGVSIHGEVTSMHIPNSLNYLAFSHFIHWPEDTLRDFGRKTLGEVFDDEAEGERFIELVAQWDAGTMTDGERAEITSKRKELVSLVQVGADANMGKNMHRFRFWCWLQKMAIGEKEMHTASFY
ncbi:MAG: hypothetical protein R6W99_08390, partial [Clostridia bacterium]